METTITSLQRTELLSGIISEQDLRTLRTACLCIQSLRIRVEARANTIERAVIDQQIQFVQTAVQYPTEDQVCVNAVKFAIIANLIALDSVLKAVCTTRALCSFQ